MKYLYIFLGVLCFILGTVGVFLPVLPTTPFMLLALFCFTKSSRKLEEKFKNSKMYKKHLEDFVKNKRLTVKRKVYLLTLETSVILLSMSMVPSIYGKICLLLVLLYAYYYFIFKVKSVKSIKSAENV